MYKLIFKRAPGKKMQPPGIEPGSPAWRARILPLDHGCVRNIYNVLYSIFQRTESERHR